MNDFGLYIHIPFCVKKCIYCDFLSKPCDADIIERYFNTLYSEIEQQGKKILNPVTTMYIGGGTPSLVDTKYIDRLFYTVKNAFNCNFTEVTIEANPESLTEEKLLCYKKNGVNRISIGVQSLNDNLLKTIGRIHNAEQAIKAVTLAKKHFDNVSADIMLGLPAQTIKDAENTVKALINCNVTHISAYGLIVEENTQLYNLIKNKLLKIDEDSAVDMYDTVVNILNSANYARYEISNFALKGYECKHNSGYWNRTDYLGLGAGAYSFINGNRWNNINNIDRYIEFNEKGLNHIENFEKIQIKDARFEEIMLSLRTVKGLDIENFNQKFSADFLREYSDTLNKVKNYIDINNGYLSIKNQYYYISNSILTEFLD